VKQTAPLSGEPLLAAHGVSKRFGATTAVADVSLTVGAGEALCLLGANGAGKTTLINLFLGFLVPDSGRTTVAGVDSAVDPQGARRRLAYIPEDVALYPDLTGLENLALFDGIRGEPKSQADYLAALEQIGLDARFAGARVATYSKGMRQKVGLAIALAKDAAALLMDEPLSGLDPKAANDFSGHLTRLKQQGRAILMATHDIFRAKATATRIGILRAGTLVQLLDARDVDAAEIERIYLQHMQAAEAVAA
jgi:ABC-2 type transport system ATP-binding protein